jgi:hypothetical protein
MNMNKIIYTASIVANAILILALLISLSYVKAITYILRLEPKGFEINSEMVMAINNDIGHISETHAMISSVPYGYKILIVHPWYDKRIPEEIRERVDQLISSGKGQMRR